MPASLDAPAPARRMPRIQRREQILTAATRAFARRGYAETNLDDIAAEAGVSRVILYRHFDSKQDLYRSVLVRIDTRLTETVYANGSSTIESLVAAATADPDGFRLLFRHATREPQFRDLIDRFTADAVTAAHQHLARVIPDPAWAQWAAELAPRVATESIVAWLDAGSPDPASAAERIQQAVHGIVTAALPRDGATTPR